ncbi:hypothetical protein AXF42_Ash007324 [Apostasia shenzhenica]|uniref:Uncharacterized protein n=1 Tax=Apostasia shenzhenica TaxID=1088818 RepID=A0A2I0B9U5_9ASPA|nr:hypothetical protein AXF42_Ash007324 [Apostasia shenzhenica]
MVSCPSLLIRWFRDLLNVHDMLKMLSLPNDEVQFSRRPSKMRGCHFCLPLLPRTHLGGVTLNQRMHLVGARVKDKQ